MQLVLMNNKEVGFEDQSHEGQVKYETEDQRIYKDIVTWRDGKEEVARKLISNLFPGGVSVVKAKLRKEGWKDYQLRLTVKHGNDNILKNLRDRFHDKVKVSVSITVMDEWDEVETSTLEGMPIKKCWDYRCEESMSFLKDFREDLREDDYFDGFDARLTITANISLSDDEIIASAHVPPSKKVLEQASFSDVEIQAKDGIKIEAHKCFLSGNETVQIQTKQRLFS